MTGRHSYDIGVSGEVQSRIKQLSGQITSTMRDNDQTAQNALKQARAAVDAIPH